jgi:hypothetical protein
MAMGTPSLDATSREPRWFVLAMAYRWPASMLLAVLVLSATASRILQQPLPVALPENTPLAVKVVGGVKVDQLALPVVQVQVAGDAPLPVSGSVKVSEAVAINGAVNVDAIEAPVNVGSFANPVPVSGDEPFPVSGSVTVDGIDGKVRVNVNPLPGGGLPLP